MCISESENHRKVVVCNSSRHGKMKCQRPPFTEASLDAFFTLMEHFDAILLVSLLRKIRLHAHHIKLPLRKLLCESSNRSILRSTKGLNTLEKHHSNIALTLARAPDHFLKIFTGKISYRDPISYSWIRWQTGK